MTLAGIVPKRVPLVRVSNYHCLHFFRHLNLFTNPATAKHDFFILNLASSLAAFPNAVKFLILFQMLLWRVRVPIIPIIPSVSISQAVHLHLQPLPATPLIPQNQKFIHLLPWLQMREDFWLSLSFNRQSIPTFIRNTSTPMPWRKKQAKQICPNYKYQYPCSLLTQKCYTSSLKY